MYVGPTDRFEGRASLAGGRGYPAPATNNYSVVILIHIPRPNVL